MHDAGVLWLQITGGEATVDRLFPQVYAQAWDYGMMITVATNGSRLAAKPLLDLFGGRRPYRLTVSVYGATEESYDGLTRRRGSFKSFSRGIAAAREAGLPLNLSLVITRHNAHELDEMRAFAENLGVSYAVYSNISPTIYGGGETLISQATEFPRKRTVFAGCGAGHTHFAVDPHGKATICKIGRDEHVSLIDEGLDGLTRLGDIADALQLRTGGCSGCALSGTCSTCRPLAKLYQEAKAPLSRYCQHGEEVKI